MSHVKVTYIFLSIVFENILIQTKYYSDTASELETSDDGSLDDNDHEDSNAIRDDDRESDQLVTHRLSGPPEDTLVGFQVAAGLSYIAESEPTEPASALVDLEPMQTEGEVTMRESEGEAVAGEVSARVSDLEPLFFESEPTHAG